MFFPKTPSPRISNFVVLQISAVLRAKKLKSHSILFFFPPKFSHQIFVFKFIHPGAAATHKLRLSVLLFFPWTSSRPASWAWDQYSAGPALREPCAWGLMLCDCHLRILNDSSLGLRFVTEVQWDNEHVQGTVPPPAASRDGIYTAHIPTPRAPASLPSLPHLATTVTFWSWHKRGKSKGWEAHSIVSSQGKGLAGPPCPCLSASLMSGRWPKATTPLGQASCPSPDT